MPKSSNKKAAQKVIKTLALIKIFGNSLPENFIQTENVKEAQA